MKNLFTLSELSNQEIIGAIVIFSGVILSQLPSRYFNLKKNNCK